MVMGNLWGHLFVTLKWGMNHRIQAVWDRSWGICLGSWKGSTRAPTDLWTLEALQGRRRAIWGVYEIHLMSARPL